VNDEQGGFVQTVLVELRAPAAPLGRPGSDLQGANLPRQLRLVGVRRVLDSAPLLDAVATQDTVSLVRDDIRGLLRVAARGGRRGAGEVAARRRHYSGQAGRQLGRRAAHEALVDELFRDGYRALFALRGTRLAWTHSRRRSRLPP
jgi:hypothetical protein